jgi:spermidine synthase
MLGLATGSGLGGRFIGPLVSKTGIAAHHFYAVLEFLIGLSAFAVPMLFNFDERLLLRLGETNSSAYLVFSALLISVSILPFCFFMGATFPTLMFYIKKTTASSNGFSFLYQANVLGAMFGVIFTAVFFIECFGFTRTLQIAGILNFIIAGAAFSLQHSVAAEITGRLNGSIPEIKHAAASEKTLTGPILFMTGFTSLGMEVVWTRAFTPVLGTQVYCFSSLLAGYLLATWLGSYVYRKNMAAGTVFSKNSLLFFLSLFVFLPIVLNDPRISFPFYGWFSTGGLYMALIALMLFSIVPLCTALGYLTPLLIDERCGGDPKDAGKFYALNMFGCILGPLFASYVLLPMFGVKYSLILLALPYPVFLFIFVKNRPRTMKRLSTALPVGLLAVSLLFSSSYELPRLKKYLVKRDYAATVTAYENHSNKFLLVNGVNITTQEPVTKIMAHLPLSLHRGKIESALVICFGMGTTYRSVLSWDIQATAIELVPSVRDVFGFFFNDAGAVLKNGKGRVIIDDGRRFLQRTKEKFDVITIDPPPPPEAAGSSLLYSNEFYALIKRRLNPGGVVQQWFPYVPGGKYENSTLSAVTRSIAESFPYVKAFRSILGAGVHYIASMEPIGEPAPNEALARMPIRAQSDLMEWNPYEDPEEFVGKILSGEVSLNALISKDTTAEVIDDRPFNEYFLGRRMLYWLRGSDNAP